MAKEAKRRAKAPVRKRAPSVAHKAAPARKRTSSVVHRAPGPRYVVPSTKKLAIVQHQWNKVPLAPPAKRGDGGFRLRGESVHGLHAILAQLRPTRQVFRVGNAGRGRSGSRRAMRIGCAVHSRLAAIVQGKAVEPSDTECHAMHHRVWHALKAHGVRPLTTEVPLEWRHTITGRVRVATRADVVGIVGSTEQLFVIEIKTTQQNTTQHKLTYRTQHKRGVLGGDTGLVDNEYNLHQMQLAATMQMLAQSTRLQVAGAVVMVPSGADAEVQWYPLDPAFVARPDLVMGVLNRAGG